MESNKGQRTPDDILDLLDTALSLSTFLDQLHGGPDAIDNFVEGDKPDEAIIIFEDRERWTVRVRKSLPGEGPPQ